MLDLPQYPGDAAWANFVEAIRPFWNPCSKKTELIAAFGGNEDLAIGAYYVAGESALEWADSEVPALGLGTPRSFLLSKAKRNALRSMMMSVP